MKRPTRLAVPSVVILGLLGALAGCDKKKAPENKETTAETTAAATDAAAKPVFDKVPRADFNRLAVELAEPLFWTSDANHDGALDPDELEVSWGLVPSAKREDYGRKGRLTTPPGANDRLIPSQNDYAQKDTFTPAFVEIYAHILGRYTGGAKNAGLDPKEAARRDAVRKELAQGRVTLVATDLTKATPEAKKFVAAIERAASLVEKLFAKQTGTFDLAGKVPADDPASRALFFRNQGPQCKAPLTEKDPNCNAIPNGPTGKLSGLYPEAMLADPKFCDALSKKESGKKDKVLMDPFTVITGTLDKPEAVPYEVAFKDDMTAISAELKSAAEALGGTEPALKAYLLAAAQSFTDNKWWPADEAWAAMNATNSKFYLRVAPDEVYEEPCSTKALFHVSFGLINEGSITWQKKLDPLKGEMENALAELAGAPYKAREVSFKLPDFIDVALNAGDSRSPSGATIGQSLPNFGPVANEGRGRTVVMTNFYTDPDSIAAAEASTASLLCKSAMEKYTSDPEPQLMSTVLHEAAHNLGPAHQYKANGKIDREAFGGPLASTLEELKAQTAALYFTDWLKDKKEIDPALADKAHVRDLVWSFGHISRGMYDENKHPKNYSQLAAIQLGWLMKEGAVAWNAEEPAANGKDKGCFAIALDKYPAAAKSLMTEVAQIKGRGDKARAEVLIKNYVDVTGDKKHLHDVIAERILRAPKASFVYSIKVD